MKRTALAALAAAFVLPGSACAEAEDPILSESGRASYKRHCSACHGMDAQGKGVLTAVLTIPPPDLTRIAARRGGVFPTSEIAAYIDGRESVAAHGPREMPVWGRVFAQPIGEGSTGEEVVRGQLLVLVEYLKSIQVPVEKKPAEAPEAP